jgi:hypothetical protein
LAMHLQGATSEPAGQLPCATSGGILASAKRRALLAIFGYYRVPLRTG